MRFPKTVLIAGAMAAGVSHAALPKSSGPYAQVMAGIGTTDTNASFRLSKFSQWFGWYLAGGYKINMFAAVEAGLTWHPRQVYDTTTKSSSNYSLSIAAKLIKPFVNGVNVYGKLGIAHLHQNLTGAKVAKNNGDATTNTYLLGLGASYAVDQNIGLTLEGSMTPSTGPFPSRRLLSAGVTYLF